MNQPTKNGQKLAKMAEKRQKQYLDEIEPTSLSWELLVQRLKLAKMAEKRPKLAKVAEKCQKKVPRRN